MEADHAVLLLEEIRDLQREHLAAYREALENQRRSIAQHEEAIAFSRRMILRIVWVAIPAIAILVGLIVWITLEFVL